MLMENFKSYLAEDDTYDSEVEDRNKEQSKKAKKDMGLSLSEEMDEDDREELEDIASALRKASKMHKKQAQKIEDLLGDNDDDDDSEEEDSEEEEQLDEGEGKKDACYKKIKAAVKAKGGEWPSAYASGRLVQCREKGADNWKEGEKKNEGKQSSEDAGRLDKWFGRKGEKGKKGGWVDCKAPDGDGGYKECAQGDRKEKPYCRPTPSACRDEPQSKNESKLSKQIMQIIYEEIEKLEIVEEEALDEASKCTKVTKKASSTRKGKKWMKCVKSDSGGYKRIHWGQAGVRVTGKSGNTKRKKSFKARHNCGSAKSNTPQGQACKDWAE